MIKLFLKTLQSIEDYLAFNGMSSITQYFKNKNHLTFQHLCHLKKLKSENQDGIQQLLAELDITPFITEMDIMYPKMKKFIKDYMGDVPEEYFTNSRNLVFYQREGSDKPKKDLNCQIKDCIVCAERLGFTVIPSLEEIKKMSDGSWKPTQTIDTENI